MRVGVIGGGQLARMMVPAAIELGIEIAVLGESAESSARIAVTTIGDHRDAEAVLAFAREVDVVTFDHEHVPQPVLRALVDARRRGAPRAGRAAARAGQARAPRAARRARRARSRCGRASRTRDELAAFLERVGGAAVVKTPRGGYDGHGVRVVARRPRGRRLARRTDRCWWRSSSTSAASSRSWSRGGPPARSRCGRSSRRCRATASAAEVFAPAPQPTRARRAGGAGDRAPRRRVRSA